MNSAHNTEYSGSSPEGTTNHNYTGIEMINISFPIPREVTIAFSGGVDSVAVADFLRRNHKITLLYVDHKDQARTKELPLVQEYACKWNVRLLIRQINTNKPKNTSTEEHWRNERYRIFSAYDNTIITCHHLDDCVETWVWSSMHGCGKLIPYTNCNVIRPFLTTRKQEFISWCKRRELEWAEDLSNLNTDYTRNYIRHEMMPHVLKINPGIHKTIKRKLLNG